MLFRSLADSVVIETVEDTDGMELTPEVKRRLAGLLRMDVKTEKGTSPLFEALHSLAYSLVQSYEKTQESLRFGKMILP